MSMTGRVNNIKIRDDNNPNDVRNFSNAKLQLSERPTPKIIITLPADDEVIIDLDDCSYLTESSVPGQVECIHINSEQKTVLIIDKNKECVELLDYMRNYLTVKQSTTKRDDRSSSPKPKKRANQEQKPIQDDKVHELIRALNEKSTGEAAELARDLAQRRESVRFALDMINESGNAPPSQPQPPAPELLKMKLKIESFLIESCPDELYDVTILEGTSIKDLKQMVHEHANIRPNRQYWYINRDCLEDDYKFGVTRTPRVNNDTVLILYIAKPQNN